MKLKCTNCGNNIADGSRFCSYCGAPAREQIQQNQMPERNTTTGNFANQAYTPVPTSPELINSTQGEDTEVFHEADRFNDSYRGEIRHEPVVRGEKRKSNTLIILLIILLVVVICSGIVLSVYFFTDVFGKNCEICQKEFETEGTYCAECLETYSCNNCDTISKEVENGYCTSCISEFTCRECGEIGDEISQGYCPDCITSFTCRNCDSVDSSVDYGYCEDCIEQFTCKECENITDTVTDGYCEGCIEGHKCDYCGNVFEILERGHCEDCLANNYERGTCFFCKTELNEKIAYKDEDGYYYCEECDTGNYCEDCGAPAEEGKSKCIYH